jgi:hypothetical protein
MSESGDLKAAPATPVDMTTQLKAQLDAQQKLIDQKLAELQMIQSTAMPMTPAAQQESKEYSAPGGRHGETQTTLEDPALFTQGAPVAPAITAAQRGRVLHNFEGAAPGVTPNPVAPLAAPQPAASFNLPPVLFFTGLSGAGKSHLVNLMGAHELKVSDCILALASQFFPSVQHSGDFVQTTLIWGAGYTDAKYPISPARLLFVNYARTIWEDFGTPGFWQRQIFRDAQKMLAEDGVRVVITTVTDDQTFTYLKEQGAQHWHVMCSPAAMQTRPKRQGASAELATKLQQQLQQDLSVRRDGQRLNCIWTSPDVLNPARLYTVPDFLQLVNQQMTSGPVTGE